MAGLSHSSDTAVSQERSLRPFYFTVVFWGAEHREYFTDLLLASLLSPNNIPALRKERQSKFLIVTTKDDWDLLQEHRLFQQLHEHMETIFFEMPFPTKRDSKMLVMSQGHKQVSMKAYEDRAYGVYVTPDLILSDGSVLAMERLAEQGKKVVLCVAIRFEQETMLRELMDGGFLKNGRPLNIPARHLMSLALNNLHSETLRYEFDAAYFADSPISVYWWVSPGKGMIIHSFSWAPLVVDYGALTSHDTKTFDNWTLDGDYIHRNFPNPGDVHVVTDSDEISLVSFTKESELHFELIPELKKYQYGAFSEVYKVGLIRALKDSLIMDPLKRYIFPKGVFLHSEDITQSWDKPIKKTAKMIADSCRPTTLWEEFHFDVIDQSATSQFASRILCQMQDTSRERFSKNDIRKYFFMWVVLVRPWRLLLRIVHSIEAFFQPITNFFIRSLWCWQYRRFVWWRLKEKLGLVEERRFDWNEGGWNAPGVSVVCPLFTLRWVWQNRQIFCDDKHNLLARFKNRYL